LDFDTQAFRIRAVSLMHPKIHSTLNPPKELDIFKLPKALPLSHLIIARGIIAYEPGTGYWDLNTARQILVNLGNKLEDGGYLVAAAGAIGAESELFDVYQKKGEVLEALDFEALKPFLNTHPLRRLNITDRLLSGFGYYQGAQDEILSEDVIDWAALKKKMEIFPKFSSLFQTPLEHKAILSTLNAWVQSGENFQKDLENAEIAFKESTGTDTWSNILLLQEVFPEVFKKIGMHAYKTLQGQIPVGPRISLKTVYADSLPSISDEEFKKAA
jgi:hypothetical protein